MADATIRPRRKIGRPKGSKNKPKWLKELEARRPKRGRGRPKGSKNKPKTLESFILLSLESENAPPELKPKPRKAPASRTAKLNDVPPEVRSERARRAIKIRWARSKDKNQPPPGWTTDQYLLANEDARREAKRIFDIMAEEGRVSDDPAAQEAMLTVLALMRGKSPRDMKLKAARTILEYTKAKPASKHDHTLRTAEDFLDDLAAEEEGDKKE